MSGYTRQSTADIIPTAVVRAAPINAEFNAIRDAFDFDSTGVTGHKHDGSADQGSYVPLIADVDGKNKVAVDTSNNRVGVFVEVSAVSTEQIRFQDGVILPVIDNDIDLGSTVLEFKNLYLDGVAKIDTLTVDENATVAGTLGVTGLSTLASADINAGTVDGTVIGSSSPQAITGTNVTATVGFFGTLTGNVTGNLTGNSAGTHTGPVVGDVTGNITAASGSSFFNDVTVNGSLNLNAGTAGTVTGLSAPVNGTDAATKTYVDTSISNLVDSAPGALDTLNELAAALGDDPNFATTVTNEIATKLPLAGGTMSGAIAMGTNKITGLGNPTANQDAATKTYVDTADATKLSLSGGTMTGNILMGANKVTSTATPTVDDDLTRKGYVDSILGSATSAAASAAAALVSETNAAASASNAATSETNAAASYDAFDDRYLGAKASAPTVDNDGDALLTGALYWNTSSNTLFIWTGSAWSSAAFDVGTALFDADIGVSVQGYNANLTGINQGLATTDSPSFSGLTATTADINGGTIDGTVIGSTSRATITGTIIAGTSDAYFNSVRVGQGDGLVFSNTVVGAEALVYGGNTGEEHTVIGFGALGVNSTGSRNTAVGYGTLAYNTTGSNNTANGSSALFSNTTGQGNVANGVEALFSNTTGWFNIATGYRALYNSNAFYNIATGPQALYSNTTGSNNIAAGYQALFSNTTGTSNVANGHQALYSNTTGFGNTATGEGALYFNATANGNTANGYYALWLNSTGAENTAIGASALRLNTTGTSNVANGSSALFSNTTGSNNVASGYQALYSNSVGEHNVANGFGALYSNTSGYFNVANGSESLYSNTTGGENTASGYYALYSNTTGFANVANGYGALANNTTGSGNIGIGFQDGSSSYAPVFDPTTENNRIVMGHTGITNAYVKVAWTVTSDARDKMDFAPVPHGLDFVNALKPTEYQFKAGGRDSDEADGIKRYGFLAQDILELEGDNPVLVDSEDPDNLKLKESNLIPVLVKAIQELSAEVQNLKSQLEEKL